MAFVLKTLPDEQENIFSRTEPTTPVPQGGGSAGAGDGNAPNVGTSTQFGSNAAKLTDYLKANQDQVGQYANEVSGNLQQGYDAAKGAIDQGFDSFNQQVNQGYSQPDQAKIDQALSNPAQYAQDPNNVQQFQSWYNNNYSGPQNFESFQPYQQINSQVNKAVDNSNLIQNYSGLGSFLDNMGTGENMTGGMKTLNTALLMRNPGAWDQVKAAAAPAKDLNSYLSGKMTAANQAAAQAKDQATNTRTDLRNKVEGQGGLVDSLQNRLNQSMTQAEQKRGEFNNAYNTFGASSEDLSKRIADINKVVDANPIPFSNGKTMRLSNPFQQYADMDPLTSPFGIQNVASQDDLAMQNALNQLAGLNLNFIPGQLDPRSVPNAPTDYKGLLRGGLDELNKMPSFTDISGGTFDQMQYQGQWKAIQDALGYGGDSLYDKMAKYYNVL